MTTINGKDLKEGMRISFWIDSEYGCRITKIYPISSPFKYITHAMRLESCNPTKTRKVDASIEHNMSYQLMED